MRRVARSVALLLLAVLSQPATAGRSGNGWTPVPNPGMPCPALEGLEDPRQVRVSPDGNQVYILSQSGVLSTWRRLPGTGLLEPVDLERNGVGGVEGLQDGIDLILSPDGAHVYVLSQDDFPFRDTILVFARDGVSGTLALAEIMRNDQAGVSDLVRSTSRAVSTDGAHVYATAIIPGAVMVFARDATTGHLTFVERQVDGASGVTDLGASAAVALSPDGAWVYVGGSDLPRPVGLSHKASLLRFARVAGTGRLTFAGIDRPTGGQVGGLTFSPDGVHLYADIATRLQFTLEMSLAIYSRDALTGALSFVAAQPGPAFVRLFFAPGGCRPTRATGRVTGSGRAILSPAPSPRSPSIGSSLVRSTRWTWRSARMAQTSTPATASAWS